MSPLNHLVKSDKKREYTAYIYIWMFQVHSASQYIGIREKYFIEGCHFT